MSAQDFLEMNSRYVFNTYGRTPIMLVEGRGTKVKDSTGKEYLDFIGGLAACPLGHAHPGLTRAIADQAGKLVHVSNLFHIRPQIDLARVLVENSFADKVFFCNSGAEANEGAIKLVRKFFHDRGDTDRHHIIAMEGSFHGRTLATLAATGQSKYRAGFDPETPGFEHVPFADIDAVKRAIKPETAAILVEPIQGEGGVRTAAEDYFPRLRSLCDETGCLLVLDEVQTGAGRTGKLLAHEHWPVTPDIVTMAKGLAGGVPIGALLATDEIAEAFVPGTHASTFGGNPLASAAGFFVLNEILADGFLEQVRRKGAYLREKLEELAEKHTCIGEVRGKGLMQAVDLTVPGAGLVSAMLEKGILVNCTAETAVRFLPPLTVTEAEMDEMVAALDACLANVGGV